MIDAYPAFLNFWEQARLEPLERQIERWASDYLSPWPELLAKQQADYTSQRVDWRQIARDKVFPFLGERLPAMAEAHDHLLKTCEPLVQQAQRALGFDTAITFIVYVGIGCGAGWVTSYEGRPAVLFGLENIAECGWSDPASITGLVAHELGHVAHDTWRAQGGLSDGAGPWWQLYTEGFAQRCEHAILGADTWHEARRGTEDDWLAWCQSHHQQLAAEFLRAVKTGEPVQPFFGSWYAIEGHSQCGYYLGHQVILELEARLSLHKVALLADAEQSCRPIVERWAQVAD